jgi:hypothetical protein
MNLLFDCSFHEYLSRGLLVQCRMLPFAIIVAEIGIQPTVERVSIAVSLGVTSSRNNTSGIVQQRLFMTIIIGYNHALNKAIITTKRSLIKYSNKRLKLVGLAKLKPLLSKKP